MSQQVKALELYRTHNAGELRTKDSGQEVVLSGWVSRRRDLGGVIFIDLRDRSGIVQVVFNPDFSSAELMEQADKLRNEYVVSIRAKVVTRDPSTVNPKIPTGEIEAQALQMEILNTAKNPPFYIQDNVDVDEMVRLKYRYLDLRRPEMQNALILRHKAIQHIRSFLDRNGFLDIETPMLTRSTPEGARDFLVPSRLHPGEFYALPQSPQLFKQLLMVSGFERYYQVARCFRDEDLRADRQPEFTQVDIEMSFMKLEDFHNMLEEMMASLFKETLGVEIPLPFQRMPYKEAMDRYGSDKPDVRFGLELKDVSSIAANCNFKVFKSAIESGGVVKAINAKGCGHYTRKQIDELEEYAKRYGAKGMAWMAFTEEGLKSAISKFFTEEEIESIKQICEVETGDLLLFGADKAKVVADVLGNLRLKLGRDLNLIPEGTFKFLWITEFPLLGYDEEEKRWVAEHHPFTMPMWEDLDKLDSDPGSVRAQAYDMVLNGYEIGGGSMRIFRRDIQEKMFKSLGFSMEEAYEKFGFLLDAFEYGTPPHGGVAFGLDRIIMLMAGRQSIRDTIAFPKTQSGSDPLTQAPSDVSERQLRDLHIRLAEQR
ncbi:aspartate--tRNA ligase [Effusibacillus dendaii]|uniref:Aspartate--tRNA ligase n=1 Tax=Effusibacillus dendaii TaxID=2743772 RepID=A0A7I8DBI8_9BACL|nr:aspartate--tRNA ligase [Effusibacillus dendaii]BCJ86329.1 aspartate--tRNA(Asp/Asn) ligase [Effusibacillus dendaii]